MFYDGTPEIKERGDGKYLYVRKRVSYVPPLPSELDVKGRIREIVDDNGEVINIAIRLCLYCVKTQIFLDSNKRVSDFCKPLSYFTWW